LQATANPVGETMVPFPRQAGHAGKIDHPRALQSPHGNVPPPPEPDPDRGARFIRLRIAAASISLSVMVVSEGESVGAK